MRLQARELGAHEAAEAALRARLAAAAPTARCQVGLHAELMLRDGPFANFRCGEACRAPSRPCSGTGQTSAHRANCGGTAHAVAGVNGDSWIHAFCRDKWLLGGQPRVQQNKPRPPPKKLVAPGEAAAGGNGGADGVFSTVSTASSSGDGDPEDEGVSGGGIEAPRTEDSSSDSEIASLAAVSRWCTLL